MAQPCTLTAHMEAQSTHTRSRPRPNGDVCLHSADDGATSLVAVRRRWSTALPLPVCIARGRHGDTWHSVVGRVRNVALDHCPGLVACDGLRPMVA